MKNSGNAPTKKMRATPKTTGQEKVVPGSRVRAANQISQKQKTKENRDGYQTGYWPRCHKRSKGDQTKETTKKAVTKRALKRAGQRSRRLSR